MYLSTCFQFEGPIPKSEIAESDNVYELFLLTYHLPSTVCSNYWHSLGSRQGLVTKMSVLEVRVNREYSEL